MVPRIRCFWLPLLSPLFIFQFIHEFRISFHFYMFRLHRVVNLYDIENELSNRRWMWIVDILNC